MKLFDCFLTSDADAFVVMSAVATWMRSAVVAAFLQHSLLLAIPEACSVFPSLHIDVLISG